METRAEGRLREALAASLARRRGMEVSAGEVVVTGGLGPSLPFVWRLLAARGVPLAPEVQPFPGAGA